tara:strand:- start:517 stop:810 length:294 start_codon:yes stop_codon:yes gene_type:complete
MKINSAENNLTQYLRNFNFDTTNCKKALSDIKQLKKADKKGFFMSEYGGDLKLDVLEELLDSIIKANERATDLPMGIPVKEMKTPSAPPLEDLTNIY